MSTLILTFGAPAVVLTLCELRALYSNFKAVYEAYTWVAYGYDKFNTYVGKKKHKISHIVKEDFVIIDTQGREVSLRGQRRKRRATL